MKCCNPVCEALFDHREGRLVRFAGTLTNTRAMERPAVLQHFWLCGRCSEFFRFDFVPGERAHLKPRDVTGKANCPIDFVTAA